MSRIAHIGDRPGDPRPSAEEVRAYLRYLLGQSAFNASERNRRFLTYVVEETLEGRADRIKAYSIALAAFDRSTDFDPLTDPIVRIEASRLRRALEHYYLTDGKADHLRIDIPKGSYIATFGYCSPATDLRAAAPPMAEAALPVSKAEPIVPLPQRRWGWRIAGSAAAILLVLATALIADRTWERFRADGGAAHSRGPSLMVMPFENIGADRDQDFIGRGLTYDIITSLTRFDDLFVYGAETSFEIGRSQNGRFEAPMIQADYVLSGSVFPTDAALRVSAVLVDSQTGQYVWSWNDERIMTPSNLLDVQADIANRVVRAVAQPYGAVFERTATEISGRPAKHLLSYACIVRFQKYWRTYDASEYDDLRTCMEKTIESDPGYARAYSSLALLYVDAYRFGYGAGTLSFDPVQRALEMADTAIRLEPMASDGYLALSVARWFAHNVDGALEAAKQGLALNPNNTTLIGELGIRYALLARWEESKAMIDQLYARNPRAPAGYRRASFFYAYMHGDYQTALTEAMAAEMPLNLYDHVMRAMAYAQLGDAERAKQAVADIQKIDPDYAQHIAADWAKRNADPSIVRAVSDGLAKAGLPASSVPLGE